MSDHQLKWSDLPEPGAGDWHSKFGGQEWKFDKNGVYLKQSPANPIRSSGSPATCKKILEVYDTEIFEAAKQHKIPPELIVMTIAVEAGAYRDSNFTGPSTFRWESSISDYSAGPMQLLGSTARALMKRSELPHEWNGVVIPRYSNRPNAKPSVNPLYDGALSIWLGSAYIELNGEAHGTGFDPILVAACYNRGKLAQSSSNAWNLSVTNDHLERAAQWYGDACAVLGALRTGKEIPSDIISASGTEIKDGDNYFEIYSLTSEQADEEQEFYLDSGADVKRFPQEGGLFTLAVNYPPTQAVPVESKKLPEPTQSGFVLKIVREKMQHRTGKDFNRTIGYYQAFYDGQRLDELSGVAVERQGPGDNKKTGDKFDRRIKAGTYSLSTHRGSSGKYATSKYANSSSPKLRPWPCIRVDGTGSRTGILIHCASGFAMTVGCINLSGKLPGGDSNIDFQDSRKRVIALIEVMREKLGAKFPSVSNVRIENAILIIEGEP